MVQVQEVPGKEFEEEGVFHWPILRIKCFEVIQFFRPVTIQLPVSLRDRQDFNPDPTKCHVRVLFLNCGEEKKNGLNSLSWWNLHTLTEDLLGSRSTDFLGKDAKEIIYYSYLD